MNSWMIACLNKETNRICLFSLLTTKKKQGDAVILWMRYKRGFFHRRLEIQSIFKRELCFIGLMKY